MAAVTLTYLPPSSSSSGEDEWGALFGLEDELGILKDALVKLSKPDCVKRELKGVTQAMPPMMRFRILPWITVILPRYIHGPQDALMDVDRAYKGK